MKISEKIATQLIEKANDTIAYNMREVTAFAEKVTQDPCAALYWSETTFWSAGEINAWEAVASIVKNGESWATLIDRAKDGIREPYSSSSTNPVINALRLSRGRAWANVLDYLEWTEEDETREAAKEARAAAKAAA